MSITDFLLARIAEDETAARAVAPLPPAYPHHGATAVSAAASLAVGEGTEDEVATLIVRIAEPSRVLAECDAKRRIVDAHELTTDVVPVHSGSSPGYGCETCHTVTASSIDDVDYVEAVGACTTLTALATIYADHPDFVEEWRF